jgi:DNA-binding response OmpR family regulator
MKGPAISSFCLPRQDTEIQTGLDLGASEYILKPFAPDQLAEKVLSILRKGL